MLSQASFLTNVMGCSMSEQKLKGQEVAKNQEERTVSPESSSTGEGPMTPEGFLKELESSKGLGVWRLLRNSAPDVKANRECVLAVVKENGLALDYAAKPLKADR